MNMNTCSILYILQLRCFFFFICVSVAVAAARAAAAREREIGMCPMELYITFVFAGTHFVSLWSVHTQRNAMMSTDKCVWVVHKRNEEKKHTAHTLLHSPSMPETKSPEGIMEQYFYARIHSSFVYVRMW